MLQSTSIGRLTFGFQSVAIAEPLGASMDISRTSSTSQRGCAYQQNVTPGKLLETGVDTCAFTRQPTLEGQTSDAVVKHPHETTEGNFDMTVMSQPAHEYERGTDKKKTLEASDIVSCLVEFVGHSEYLFFALCPGAGGMCGGNVRPLQRLRRLARRPLSWNTASSAVWGGVFRYATTLLSLADWIYSNVRYATAVLKMKIHAQVLPREDTWVYYSGHGLTVAR